MPIYEFDCTDCGEGFEKLVRMSAIDDVTCPNCGGKKVKKKLSIFASSSGSSSSSASSSSSSASCSTGGG